MDTKILIVDDSSFARVLTRNHLRDLGYTKISEVSSVEDAQMTMLAPEHVQKPFGLVISDMNMPKVTGLEFLKWVRAHPELKGLPFVMVTASQDLDEIKQAWQLSISHFLLKPLELPVLRERLGLVWKKHGEAFTKSKLMKPGSAAK